MTFINDQIKAICNSKYTKICNKLHIYYVIRTQVKKCWEKKPLKKKNHLSFQDSILSTRKAPWIFNYLYDIWATALAIPLVVS